MTWLISACLTGQKCRYDGGDCLIEEIAAFAREQQAVTACCEELGGLGTPRLPSELTDAGVYNIEGQDVTAAYEKGSELALQLALENHCDKAILKEGSPSCGVRWVYDGTFSRTRVPSCGILTRKLLDNGIACMNEYEFLEEMKHESV